MILARMGTTGENVGSAVVGAIVGLDEIVGVAVGKSVGLFGAGVCPSNGMGVGGQLGIFVGSIIGCFDGDNVGGMTGDSVGGGSVGLPVGTSGQGRSMTGPKTLNGRQGMRL